MLNIKSRKIKYNNLPTDVPKYSEQTYRAISTLTEACWSRSVFRLSNGKFVSFLKFYLSGEASPMCYSDISSDDNHRQAGLQSVCGCGVSTVHYFRMKVAYFRERYSVAPLFRQL